jgi:hypothetical protein
MWGIFWGICWKSILTWLVGVFAFIIWGIFQEIVIGDIDYEDSLVCNLIKLWVIIGIIACIVAFVSLIVLMLITIWN